MSGERGGSLRAHRASTDRGTTSTAGSRIGRGLRPALLMVLVAAALTSAVAVPRSPVVRVDPASRVRPFVVHGHVSGLYPGVRKQMRIIVRNPQSFTVRVTQVTARVSNASIACRSRNVRIVRFTGSRTIPGHGRIRIYLSSRMRRRAPNACQGARFPVTFTATMARA